MDDAFLVRGFQGFGHSDARSLTPLPAQWAESDPVGERRPFDQLHHQRLRGRLPRAPVKGWTLRSRKSRRCSGIERGQHPALRGVNCARRSGSSANSPGNTFKARRRDSASGRARVHSPMPPAPSGPTTS